MNKNKNEIYSSKSVVIMVGLFFILFWLLYSIGSFLHKSQKISQEIEQIRQENLKSAEEIKKKKKYLEYLKTPQRIEKEAKMQMGKKLPGEKVIVFVEESIDLLPTEKKQAERKKILNISNWKKWQWLFFGDREKLAPIAHLSKE